MLMYQDPKSTMESDISHKFFSVNLPKCEGNLAVLLAIRNDLRTHVFIKASSQRKIYGKYLIPLLILGADTLTCLESLTDQYDESDNSKFSLLEVVRQTNGYNNLFPIFVLFKFQVKQLNFLHIYHCTHLHMPDI
jgi:hypothetical protein